MSGFTKTVSHEIEFDGDTVQLELRRLNRKDMTAFSEFIKEGDDGKHTVSIQDGMQLMKVAEEILPEYVVNMTGLKDASGNPLSLDDVLAETYFMELLGNIVGRLMEISFPGKEDEKKSE